MRIGSEGALAEGEDSAGGLVCNAGVVEAALHEALLPVEVNRKLEEGFKSKLGCYLRCFEQQLLIVGVKGLQQFFFRIVAIG